MSNGPSCESCLSGFPLHTESLLSGNRTDTLSSSCPVLLQSYRAWNTMDFTRNINYPLSGSAHELRNRFRQDDTPDEVHEVHYMDEEGS